MQIVRIYTRLYNETYLYAQKYQSWTGRSKFRPNGLGVETRTQRVFPVYLMRAYSGWFERRSKGERESVYRRERESCSVVCLFVGGFRASEMSYRAASSGSLATESATGYRLLRLPTLKTGFPTGLAGHCWCCCRTNGLRILSLVLVRCGASVNCTSAVLMQQLFISCKLRILYSAVYCQLYLAITEKRMS